MWKFIGTVLTNSERDWRFSRPTNGQFFRIKPSFIDSNDPKFLIAQSIRHGQNFIYDRQEIKIPEPGIFKFDFPNELGERVLAFKKIDSIIRLDIEVLIGTQSPDSLTELINTSEKIMDYLYNRGNGRDLTPGSGSVDVVEDVASLLVNANSKRSKLIIRCDVDTKLFANLDEATGNPSDLIEEVRAGEVFLLPIANGIYKGAVYAKSEKDAQISFTEYSA